MCDGGRNGNHFYKDLKKNKNEYTCVTYVLCFTKKSLI